MMFKVGELVETRRSVTIGSKKYNSEQVIDEGTRVRIMECVTGCSGITRYDVKILEGHCKGQTWLHIDRSELIRVAVRDFLLRELKMANNLAKYKEAEIEEFDDENYVRVPIEKLNEDKEPVREFKTYKIIKRLEY